MKVQEARDVFVHELRDELGESPGIVVKFLPEFDDGLVLGMPKKARNFNITWLDAASVSSRIHPAGQKR